MQGIYRLTIAWDKTIDPKIPRFIEEYFNRLGIPQANTVNTDESVEVEYTFEGSAEGFTILKKSAGTILDLVSNDDFRIGIFGSEINSGTEINTEEELCENFPKKDEIRLFTSRALERDYPEFYRYLVQTYGADVPGSEMCYMYYNGLKERPVCKTCGGRVRYGGISMGYYQYCSPECWKNRTK